MDYSLHISSVHGILQARILEWVAFPAPGDTPDPEIEPVSLESPQLASEFFTTCEALQCLWVLVNHATPCVVK